MNPKSFFPFIFSLLGIIDASYLSYEHYSQIILPCSTNILFLDCAKVLQSSYAELFHVPLSVYGIIFYSSVLIISLLTVFLKNKRLRTLLTFLTTVGLG